MTSFQGFKTKKEADEYAKKNGGMVWTRTKDKYSPYEECVVFGGLDPDKYPFVVIKRDV